MRDVTTSEQARIRNALVERRMQDWKQATAGTLADFHCEYCKLDFLDPKRPDNFLTWVGWDHLIPVAKDGSDDVDNLVCSCCVCNFVKGQWDPRTDERFKGRLNAPPREELILAAYDHIKEKKKRKDQEEVQVWRDIVGRK